MVDNPTSQSTAQDPTLRTQRRQLEGQYTPPVVDRLTQEAVLALPAEALVVIAGGPNCDIRGANTIKKIPNDAAGMAFVAGRMPQLVGSQGWNTRLDYDCDGQVEYHEILASLMRGAQIAYQRGIPLDQVPVTELNAADIAPISARLTGHAPEVCLPTPRTPAPAQNTEQTQGR